MIEKVKKTLNPWRSKSATLAGKITIVNALIMSQTVYKILSLNTPDKRTIGKIKKLITDFVWNCKRAKVAYNNLVQTIEKGGLKLVDFEAKNGALKCTWIKKASDTKFFWKVVADALLPMPLIEMEECNLNLKYMEKIGIKTKWCITSVLQAWYEITSRTTIKTEREVLNQCIWLSSNIRKMGKPYILPSMKCKGIMYMRDIVNQVDGQYFSFAELKESFGEIGNFLEYMTLITSIPREWKKLIKDKEVGVEEKDISAEIHNIKKISPNIRLCKNYTKVTRGGGVRGYSV